MTSADVRDVFELPLTDAAPKKKQKHVGERRPKGISRELFSLLGENSAPLVIYQNKLKERPKINQKAKRWVWQPFTNNARDDGLVLHHWVQKSETPPEAYRFEKFNTHAALETYSDDEYERLLRDDDWSREETDYLMELCKEYDVRFFIIADRYIFKGRKRRLEDIKDRLCKIQRALLVDRHPLNTMTAAQSALYNSLAYDKDQEIARKEYLERLMARTPEEIAEEEALFIELKRIQATQEKMIRDREDILRLLSEQKPTSNAQEYLTSSGLSGLVQDMAATEKARKRVENPKFTSGVDMYSSRVSAPVRNMNGRSLRRGPMPDDAIYGVSWHEKLQTGAFVRSQRLPTIKASLTQRVYGILAELGIPMRLVMPTERTCTKFTQLQNDIVTLLELKRQVDRLGAEHDIQEKLNHGGA
ncbi:Swr1 complex subunit Swc4 [Schizosaccharomyces japonicus yFS275]|uniref:SWR1-complex protein 4 n=1 Tax=Schizosaccharomyces japonicus (strain yFS275 / FY16936) TaxID=402676 RepID=B6K2B7_SCHJY|nr:Swr1 complex subunit Swc4 [Schizosaccharomyces japonicus yFS275]EEB07298.2 Swr1 complex subunit Swc4 [Schizosaccharomyces japonicus yFS275]